MRNLLALLGGIGRGGRRASDRGAERHARQARDPGRRAAARADLERLMVLAGMSEDHPLWKVVLSYADEHARNELNAALQPDLSDAQRQFNAGRAAGADDFAQALRDLHANAQLEARKRKKE